VTIDGIITGSADNGTTFTPFLPEKIEAAAKALFSVSQPKLGAAGWDRQHDRIKDRYRRAARAAIAAYHSI
jgi:hypothetical protein